MQVVKVSLKKALFATLASKEMGDCCRGDLGHHVRQPVEEEDGHGDRFIKLATSFDYKAKLTKAITEIRVLFNSNLSSILSKNISTFEFI